MDSFDELEREIEKTKEEFYGDSGKNFFFKKQQKFDCAKHILNKIPLDVLLNNIFRIIENTCILHIDYPMLKSIASPEIFDIISEHILIKCQKIKTEYGSLEIAVNLDGFTISAAERYKVLIQLFCQKCFQYNTGFSSIVSGFVVYNAPGMLDSIAPVVKPLMTEEIKSRMIIIQKKDSLEIAKKYSTL